MSIHPDLAVAFRQGFDRGNYGHAYESHDWDTWRDAQSPPEEFGRGALFGAWSLGVTYGWVSSLELREMPADLRRVVNRPSEQTREMARLAGIEIRSEQ